MATALQIRLNRDEFSRLEDDRRTLVATILTDPAVLAAPERVRVDLVKARRRRDAVVASATLDLPAGDNARGQRASFDLSRILDADGLSAVRRGRYLVRATALSSPGVAAESPELELRLITAQRLRAEYLHGLDRLPADFLRPKYQPRVVTGVEIVEVEPNVQPGFYPLTCNVDASGRRTLKWAGGRTVALDPAFSRFVVPDNRDGWIEVEVTDAGSLPPASVEESLLIERGRLGEAQFGHFIDRASDWLEHTVLQVFLEPTILSTDGEFLPQVIPPGHDLPPPAGPFDWDFVVPPATMYPRVDGKWMGIRFPYAHVTRVYSVVGQIAGSPVMAIPPGWLQIQEKNGFAQLVPYHQHAAWALFNVLAGSVFYGAIEIPNFWKFVLRAGLRAVPEDVVEAIAKKAAMDALTAIGQAFKPGIGSESFSKELSVSVSYVRNAQANLLSATRAEYKQDLDELIPRLRSKYLGLATATFV